MKRITMIATIGLFSAALLAACGKKNNESANTTGRAAGSAVATGSDTAGSAAAGSAAVVAAGSGSGSGAPAAEEPVEVPTAMDFEDEAAAKIYDKNLEARVKALEAELGQ
jgi:hypothetical protein